MTEQLSGTIGSTVRRSRDSLAYLPEGGPHARPLQAVIDAGLTSVSAIGIATGISEREIRLLVDGRIAPTKTQREIIGRLAANYRAAITLVNVETLRDRL